MTDAYDKEAEELYELLMLGATTESEWKRRIAQALREQGGVYDKVMAEAKERFAGGTVRGDLVRRLADRMGL